MKKSALLGIAFWILIFSVINIDLVQSQSLHQLQQMVSSIEGLTTAEQEQLNNALSAQFLSITEKEILNEAILTNIGAIISACIFEGGTIEVAAEIAHHAYLAEKNGARDEYVQDLALIGISTKMTANQLEMAAKGIEKLVNAGIETNVTEEFISYALYNNWGGETIEKTTQGLVDGVSQGLKSKRLALAFIIGVDQEIQLKPAIQIVNEAIDFLKTEKQKSPEKAQRQEIAFQELQNVVNQGIPGNIADEIYYTAIEDEWSPELIKAVYRGMIDGTKMGLSAEKLATSILVRLAQTEQVISPAKLIAEEINFVTGVEKKRSQLIKTDEQKYKRKSLPPNYNIQQSTIQSKPIPQKTPPLEYYNTTNRSTLNQQLMWQNMQEYLGPPATPYRWGGTSKSGIDCSGFVMNVFRQKGIWLPRTSRKQYQVGRLVVANMQFGDLVFFSKYGPAYQVTHVGIYLGGDRFIHSSASRGVSVSSLNKRYYRLRFKGAKRII